MDIKLKDGIDWVGYVDWSVRDFHSYHTIRGATYNAYLVRDERTALVDTVKAPFTDELLANIAALIPLENVDYVVCNHAEPDHAGGLARVLQAMPSATLLCNAKCMETLSKYHVSENWNVRVVEDGETLSLGQKTLQFINTPMVHWPESMFTYVPESRVLFSMDAFGQHLATSHRFDDDETPLEVIMEEAKKYYANIVMPYGKQVQKVLAAAADLPIDILATSHGVIWRKHISTILQAYQDWAAYKTLPKVLVLYDTMWDSTAQMARAIVEGASELDPQVDVRLLAVRTSDLTEIATEAMDAAAIAVGSSTLNSRMMPSMASVGNYLAGLRVQDRAGLAFGSYGWASNSVKDLAEWMETVRWTPVAEPIKSQYAPTAEVLQQCRAAGRLLAEKAAEHA